MSLNRFYYGPGGRGGEGEHGHEKLRPGAGEEE